jgi:hypothetical protein
MLRVDALLAAAEPGDIAAPFQFVDDLFHPLSTLLDAAGDAIASERRDGEPWSTSGKANPRHDEKPFPGSR